MESTASIDKIDKAILALLQANASASLQEVSDHVSLSATPCWRRIQRLEEAQTYIRPLTDAERVVRIGALKEGTPAHAAVWAIVLRH